MYLLQEDGPRQEELKVLKDPEVFLWIILDEGKSKLLLDPEILFDALVNFNFGGRSSFGWFPNLEEEEWKGR